MQPKAMHTESQPAHAWTGVGLCLLIALAFAWTPIRDPDAWYHLATGRLIAETHAIPTVDTWTFTAAGHRWITHEWLYELALYGLYVLGGFSAMVVFRVTIIGGAIWALDQVAALKGARPALRYPLLIAAAACASPRYADRPQIVTFLGVGLTLLLLERAAITTATQADGKRAHHPWLLVPLAWVWANCHAGVIYLLAIGGAYWLDLVLRRANAEKPWRSLICLQDRSVRALTLCLVGAGAVILLTPNHIHTLLYGFETSRRLTQAGFTTLELLSARRHGAPDEVLAIAVIAAALVLIRVRPLRETLLPLALGFWALRWMRERATFLLLLLPCYAAWTEAGWRQLSALTHPARRTAALGAAGMLLAATVGLAIRGAELPANRRLTPDPLMPAGLAAFHQAHGLPARVFNPHAWGSYLNWISAGVIRVFIDARLDVFPPEILSGYLAVLRGDRTMLERFDVSCCLLDYDESYPAGLGAVPTLRDQLFASPDWVLVHWNDEGMIYLRRDIGAAQFANLPALRIVNPNIRNWDAYVAAGKVDEAAAELRTVIARTPNSLRPRRFLGYLWLTAGRWSEAAETFRALVEEAGQPSDLEAYRFAAGEVVRAELKNRNDGRAPRRE